MNIQKHPLIFVFMTFCISRIMNAKKISKFEREVKSNGNTLLPHTFFFLSLVFSYEHVERFPTLFFVCPVSISRIMNAKKNSKFEREVKSNGNTLLSHTFFFLSLDCSYEHSERFPTIFFHALLVFVQY